MSKIFKLTMDRKVLLKTLSFIKKNYKLANTSKNQCAESITIAAGSSASVDERGCLSSTLIRYVTTEMDLSADVEAFHCEGEITLPFLLLYDLVRCAIEDTVCIELGTKETSVKITCGEHYTAHLAPVQDSKAINTNELNKTFRDIIVLAEGELKYLVDLTAPFISEEETRYYLNGICFEVNPQEIRTIATNGHILGTRYIDKQSNSSKKISSFIVPKEAIKILKPLLKNKKALLLFNETTVEFRIDNWCIVSKLIDGKYPDWRRVLPVSKIHKKITIASSDILQLSKLKKIEFGEVLKLEFEKRKLQMRCNRFVGASVSIHRNGQFPSFGTKGFNRFYLRDIAKAFGAENLIFDLTPEPGDQVSITSDNTADNGYVILMPMRV